MTTTPVPLPPESKALIEQLIRERDAAAQRIDVALLATKAALGVPVEWQIRSLEEGFVANEHVMDQEVVNNGGNN